MCARSCDILTYSLYRGDATSQHTFDLARTLAQTGFRPTIHSNYPPHDLPDDIGPISRHTSYASYVPTADLTILQYPLWFPLAERFRAAPAARLFWYHGVTPPEHWPVPGERDLLRNSQIRTNLANCAHLAVAASPFTAAELHSHSGYPLDNIRVVPLGVDTAAFGATPEASWLEQVRNRWGLEDKRVVLYVGRVAGNKRIDIIIRALAILQSQFPNLRLLVVGETGGGVATQVLTQQLKRFAREQAVTERVIFTGRVADVAPYYHISDVLVLPSEHEGFGVPLVEAMAAGTPVIASASSALPWLLGADVPQSNGAGTDAAGLLFAPGNAEQLAEHIGSVLTGPEVRERLVTAGRARAHGLDLRSFRALAGVTMFEAIERHRSGKLPPAGARPSSALCEAADVVQRDFVDEAYIPLLGKHIVRARAAATVHLKEAYFDRVMEQQVNYNRALALAIDSLGQRISAAGERTSDRVRH